MEKKELTLLHLEVCCPEDWSSTSSVEDLGVSL